MSRFQRREGPSVGVKFNRWTVIGGSRRRGVGRKARLYSPCKCECGTEREVVVYGLTSNQSTSCGCLRHIGRRRGMTTKELAAERLLKYKYGINLSVLNEMARRQGYRCAICNRPVEICKYGRTDRLTVDHDHTTDQVRCLLCDHCNRGLGMFGDNPVIVFRAAEYLARYRVASEVGITDLDHAELPVSAIIAV